MVRSGQIQTVCVLQLFPLQWEVYTLIFSRMSTQWSAVLPKQLCGYYGCPYVWSGDCIRRIINSEGADIYQTVGDSCSGIQALLPHGAAYSKLVL